MLQKVSPDWLLNATFYYYRTKIMYVKYALLGCLVITNCFSKIQIGLTFLVPAHPGSPGQRAIKRVCMWSNH